VVPLYAFLTTRCAHDAASRTIAANNIVNSLAMVMGSAIAIGMTSLGIPVVEQLLLAAAMTGISAWLGWLLFKAEKEAGAARGLLDADTDAVR
jgi:membrane protein implicated in regulation of membrane protease activity